MYPLRSYQPFLDLMVRMENPALGVLVGMVFTALVLLGHQLLDTK